MAEALNLYELYVFFLGITEPSLITSFPPQSLLLLCCEKKKKKEEENVCVLLFMIKIWIEFVTALQHLGASWALT